MKDKIKVLIIDDSKAMRKLLSNTISAASDIEVVGEASDPIEARDKIKRLNPDVLTLDIEMPKMDGLTFLKNIMRLRPMPIIMISSLTNKGSNIAMDALELGAVDCLCKPVAGGKELQGFFDDVLIKVRAAYYSNLLVVERGIESRKSVIREDNKVNRAGYTFEHNALILIGSSTGGINAITHILNTIPEVCPPIVIVQHIPPVFSASLAKRLDSSLPLSVHEVEDGMVLQSNSVYIAKGGYHLRLKKRSNKVVCYLDDGESINNHKPSVNAMFSSAVELSDVKIAAAILTGMGSDGAESLLKLKESGHYTVVQDEASSVVWGMPKVAFEIGAHNDILPLNNIANALLNSVGRFK